MRVTALIATAMLTGCASTPRVEIQRVNVPVPVECKEPMPERPAMPTETLRPGASVDDYTRASQAEIERREGYEGQLRTALDNCRSPLEVRHAP